MASFSSIEWTNHTFNIVHGCTKVSEACRFCYAETLDLRRLHGKELHWGPNASRLQLSDAYWNEPFRWNRRAAMTGVNELVFCSSMADVFEEHADVERARNRLWPIIETTPNLTWQLLTKRPENIMSMVPERWRQRFPENVWAMTTAENQKWFDVRAKHLLAVPAVVHGFSCEPLLGPIKLGETFKSCRSNKLWVIAGGESSQSAECCRATSYDWFAGLRDQCVKHKIPFFFKQWGNRHEDGEFRAGEKSYRVLDGREWNEIPV